MEKYKLERTGLPPLSFEGQLLAEAEGQRRNENRWHEIRAYQTKGGRYVLEIVYRTQWQGETDHHWVIDAESPKALTEGVKEYNPVMYALGFPPGKQFEEKQQRMIAGLRMSLAVRISAVFRQIPGAEEVIE